MKPTLARFRSARFDDESGIALPEVITAAIVIVLILVANAYGLLSAYSAYGTAESSSKAYQIINSQFAYFKQAPWNQLGTVALENQLVATRLGAGNGCDLPATPFNGENVSYLPRASSYKYTGDANEMPFQFCQAVQYQSQAKPVVLYDVRGNAKTAADGTAVGGLGTTYYYQTVITNVTTASYDSSSQQVQSDMTTYYNAKRITVTVTWRENDSAGNTKTQRLRLSSIRTPLLAECAPTGVKTATGATIAAQGCGVG